MRKFFYFKFLRAVFKSGCCEKKKKKLIFVAFLENVVRFVFLGFVFAVFLFASLSGLFIII